MREIVRRICRASEWTSKEEDEHEWWLHDEGYKTWVERMIAMLIADPPPFDQSDAAALRCSAMVQQRVHECEHSQHCSRERRCSHATNEHILFLDCAYPITNGNGNAIRKIMRKGDKLLWVVISVTVEASCEPIKHGEVQRGGCSFVPMPANISPIHEAGSSPVSPLPRCCRAARMFCSDVNWLFIRSSGERIDLRFDLASVGQVFTLSKNSLHRRD
jgi:hypothetical protein